MDYRNTIVHKINRFAEYDPYTIQNFTGGNVYSGERTEYSVYPSWDHWPISQMPSDGRKSRYSDRTSHSSLTHVFWDFSVMSGDQGLFSKKVLLDPAIFRVTCYILTRVALNSKITNVNMSQWRCAPSH